MRKRRSFTPEFRHEAVRLALESDRPLSEIARELGIRPDQFERIFERFYTDRADADASAFGQNSGLGLSISKQIVEAHNGRIWAENRSQPSKTPGEPPEILGARFTVRLPAA